MSDRIAQNVERFGWSCLAIPDGQPPFTYTVGLMKSFEHPELIIMGRLEDGGRILAALVAAIQDGARIDQPQEYELLKGFPIATRPVDETQHELYLGYAMGFLRECGRIGELEAVQVFFPDAEGRYPFQPGCSLSVYLAQPRLDIPLTEEELNEWKIQWE
ncbi:MAG: DUF4262 domain-containing protein [Planctomycetaceae bacterium]|nr:DUF4262 domain-containing protein [Planctomycetaceae bacterium]